MSDDRVEIIRTRLTAALQPSRLEIADEGYLHAGHAEEGAGHFAITICADALDGKPLVQQHRLVYDALQLKALIDSELEEPDIEITDGVTADELASQMLGKVWSATFIAAKPCCGT